MWFKKHSNRGTQTTQWTVRKREYHCNRTYDYDKNITCITKTVDAERVRDGKEKDTVKENTRLLLADMLLGKDMVKFQIDCRASCNIMAAESRQQAGTH